MTPSRGPKRGDRVDVNSIGSASRSHALRYPRPSFYKLPLHSLPRGVNVTHLDPSYPSNTLHWVHSAGGYLPYP